MGLGDRALITSRGWVFNFKRGQDKFYPYRKGERGKGVLAMQKGRHKSVREVLEQALQVLFMLRGGWTTRLQHLKGGANNVSPCLEILVGLTLGGV